MKKLISGILAIALIIWLTGFTERIQTKYNVQEKILNSSMDYISKYGVKDKKKLTAMLVAYAKKDKSISYLYVGLPNKTFILNVKIQLPSDYDPTLRPWYTAAVSSKNNTHLETYLDIVTNKTIVTISKPVYKSKILIAVLGVDFYPAEQQKSNLDTTPQSLELKQ
jgi:hypothetical protein